MKSVRTSRAAGDGPGVGSEGPHRRFVADLLFDVDDALQVRIVGIRAVRQPVRRRRRRRRLRRRQRR